MKKKSSGLFGNVIGGGYYLKCPAAGCDAVPHMRGTIFGPGIPPSSTSGAGLIIECVCEEGHHWQITFEDHSGTTYIGLVWLPDLVCGPDGYPR